MSGVTVVKIVVCRYCQTEITDRWWIVTEDVCADCYLIPLRDQVDVEWVAELSARGLLPVRFIGC